MTVAGRRAHVLVCALLALAVLPLGASPQEEDTSSPALRIGWKEFRDLYDAKKIEVVDVRGDVLYESGHIPGARSIPLDQIDKHVSTLRGLKKPIVLYCA